MSQTPVSPPRLTLFWGGVALVLGTVMPLFNRATFALSPRGWVYYGWETSLGWLWAGLVLAGFAVLAFGIGKESGIAGRSILGKIALLAFAIAGLFTASAAFGPMPTLGADPAAQQLFWVVLWSATLVSLVSVLVAAVEIVRARILHGVARWGIPALALAYLVTLVAERAPVHPVGGIALWGAIMLWGGVAIPLLQLVTGVLFAVQGRPTLPRHGLQPAPEA